MGPHPLKVPIAKPSMPGVPSETSGYAEPLQVPYAAAGFECLKHLETPHLQIDHPPFIFIDNRLTGDDVPIQASIYRGFPVAMFDDRRGTNQCIVELIMNVRNGIQDIGVND